MPSLEPDEIVIALIHTASGRHHWFSIYPGHPLWVPIAGCREARIRAEIEAEAIAIPSDLPFSL